MPSLTTQFLLLLLLLVTIITPTTNTAISLTPIHILKRESYSTLKDCLHLNSSTFTHVGTPIDGRCTITGTSPYTTSSFSQFLNCGVNNNFQGTLSTYYNGNCGGKPARVDPLNSCKKISDQSYERLSCVEVDSYIMIEIFNATANSINSKPGQHCFQSPKTSSLPAVNSNGFQILGECIAGPKSSTKTIRTSMGQITTFMYPYSKVCCDVLGKPIDEWKFSLVRNIGYCKNTGKGIFEKQSVFGQVIDNPHQNKREKCRRRHSHHRHH
jgi:hypothetical protein